MQFPIGSGGVYFISSIVASYLTCKLKLRSPDSVNIEKDLPYEAYQIESTSTPQGHVKFHSNRMDRESALARARNFYLLQNQRRSLRFFSKDDVPIELLLQCIATAGTAPSGAHQQPWHFSIVKSDVIKHQIREIVEKEEQVRLEGVYPSHFNALFSLHFMSR